MEPSLIVHRRVLKNVEFFQHFFQYCQHNVEHFKPPLYGRTWEPFSQTFEENSNFFLNPPLTENKLI